VAAVLVQLERQDGHPGIKGRNKPPTLPLAAAPPVASMQQRRRGGNPFSCATSSRNAWFSVRSAAIVACCTSAPLRSAVLSDCNRRTSPTRHPTTSPSSASENLSSDAASRNDIQAVNHATAFSATTSPRNLPRLHCVKRKPLKQQAFQIGSFGRKVTTRSNCGRQSPTARSPAGSAPTGVPTCSRACAPSSAPLHAGAKAPTRLSNKPYAGRPSLTQVEQRPHHSLGSGR